MTKEQLWGHMLGGGQIYRNTRRHRFYYKIKDGGILCRCNELGGWHHALGGIRWGSDDLHIARWDYDYEPWNPSRVVRKPLPPLDGMPTTEQKVTGQNAAPRSNGVEKRSTMDLREGAMQYLEATNPKEWLTYDEYAALIISDEGKAVTQKQWNTIAFIASGRKLQDTYLVSQIVSNMREAGG